MIVLDYILIEGFGSIVKELKYKFNRNGLVIITGLNGVGKTTIFNALSWGLYKQLLKKGATIEPWPHILDSSYQGTKVQIDFHDTKTGDCYSVIRCLNYKGKIPAIGRSGRSGLYIFHNNKPISSERDKADANKWIVEKIGYTFDLFKSAILFGQKVKRLTEETGPDKKKIFDEAFETTFISRALEVVSKRLKVNHLEHGKLVLKLDKHKTLLSKSREELRRAKDTLKFFNDRINSQVADISGEMESLELECSELAKKINSKSQKRMLRDLEEEKALILAKQTPVDSDFELILSINRTASEIEALEDKTKRLRIEIKNLPKTCSKCGQKLPSKERKEYKNNLSGELIAKEAQIKILSKELESLREGEKGIKKALAKREREKAQISEIETELINITKANEKAQWDIESKREKIESLRAKKNKLLLEKPPQLNLYEIRGEIKALRNTLKGLKGELKVWKKSIRTDEWLLKDPLSNSGLKAFIFDSMLSKVNNNLRAYKDITGFGIKVYVEMSSARKDICISVTRSGNEVPYEDLSGGQKQLVDVALAFALHDTVNSLKPINLLLMDEIFESLSKNNIEVVGSMVERLAQKKSIHLITHHSNFNPINTYRVEIGLSEQGHTTISTKYRDN